MSKQIQDAYIVSAIRTPVGKAPRGVFRNTRPDDMLAFAHRCAHCRKCPRHRHKRASTTPSSAARCPKPSKA